MPPEVRLGTRLEVVLRGVRLLSARSARRWPGILCTWGSKSELAGHRPSRLIYLSATLTVLMNFLDTLY
jgi:hypothetical protein